MLNTSNGSGIEWSTVSADPDVATTILDRFLHHSRVLTTRCDSYQLGTRRKRGLIKPPANDGTTIGSVSLSAVTIDHQLTS